MQSPNRADALALTFAYPVMPRDPVAEINVIANQDWGQQPDGDYNPFASQEYNPYA